MLAIHDVVRNDVVLRQYHGIQNYLLMLIVYDIVYITVYVADQCLNYPLRARGKEWPATITITFYI